MLHFLWTAISTLVIWFCKGFLCFVVLALLAGPILRRFGYGVARSPNGDPAGGQQAPADSEKPQPKPNGPRASREPGLSLEEDPIGSLRSGPIEDELLYSSEIGMGGPIYGTWMLRDGAIFEDISVGWYEVGQGRYTAAEADVRSGRRWVLYDRHSHTVYRMIAPSAMEQIRRLRLAGEDAAKRGTANLELEALLQSQQGEALSSFRGLWLDKKLCPQCPEVVRSDVLQRHELTAHLWLPDDLRYAQRLLNLVQFPPYEIYLDDVPTRRYASSLDSVFSTPDESLLVVKGMATWHFFNGNQWHSIDSRITRNSPGNRTHNLYFLTTVAAIEKNCVEFEIDWLCIPKRPVEEVPEWVDLRTTYAPRAITLRTRDNRLAVPLEWRE